MLKYMVAGAVAAFVVSGPLQHVGALPQTVVGDLSKQAIKSVLGMTAKDAFAGCKGNGGFGGGNGGGRDFGSNHGNNGNHGNGNNGNHGNGNNGNGKGKKHGRDD